MTERLVRMDTLGKYTRRVVLEDGQPVEYALEIKGQEKLVGNLYLGRVENLLRGMEAAFVDIGLQRNAFLPFQDMPPIARDGESPSLLEKPKHLKTRETIIVQVVKEPSGEKGPKVTMNPTFPGQYAVLLPTLQTVGVSRHIQGEEKRGALLTIARQACPEGMGLIIRTAAEDAPYDAILAEAKALALAWQDMATKARAQKAPALLMDSGSLASQARRDIGGDIRFGPFEDALEEKLTKALAQKVWLPCGGFLVIDTTEAMTVIDVNSGKYTGKKSLAHTMGRLNMEAAKEIPRLLRLRDIGGIIIIDFVDMDSEEERETVLAAFREALEGDRAKSHIHGFTGAGLLEMTRRPIYQPIRDALACPCPHCHGSGAVPSRAAHGIEIHREIIRRAVLGDAQDMTIEVPAHMMGEIQKDGLPVYIRLVPKEA